MKATSDQQSAKNSNSGFVNGEQNGVCLVKQHWGWLLPFIAVGFLCYAASEYGRFIIDDNLREFYYRGYDSIDHKPVKDMEIECPTELAEGETATIKATITNDGPTAEFDISFWPNFNWDFPAKCSRTITIGNGDTFSMECEISGDYLAETRTLLHSGHHSPSGVVVWAMSSEDDDVMLGVFPNSYRAVCLIPDIAVNQYSAFWAAGYLATGVGLTVSFALWLRTRSKRL